MAKINLLTIHWGNCFGAVMQTYATKKLLEEHGHQVTIINLVPKYAFKRVLNIKRIMKMHSWADLQYLLFKKKYFGKMTKIMFHIDSSNIPDADYTIVGSDQTWNPIITQNFKYNFFLDFVKGGEKISFASSFGEDIFSGNINRVSELLKSFSAISVREDTGVEILSSVFHLSAIQLVDPTLGLGHYENFVTSKKYPPYLYSYLLKSTQEETAIVDFVSNELGLKMLSTDRWKEKFSSGPLDKFNYINSASFVVASSFHGLAFSIMLHKSFIVLCADKQKFTRLRSLLKLLHLEDRYIQSISDIKSRKNILLNPINYSEVDSILEKERMKVHQFISDNIK